MQKSRAESFSDSVIAIIMTIMVLDMKVPQGVTLADLQPLGTGLLCYVLSFLYLAIYWNNHHHLFQAVKEVNTKALWANIHLLLWLSLVPFVTAWAGGSDFASVPTALYGFTLAMTGFAFWLLSRVLIAQQENSSLLEAAHGRDAKTLLSIILFGVSIPLAWWYPYLSFFMFLVNAFIWIVPDVNIEKRLKK